MILQNSRTCKSILYVLDRNTARHLCTYCTTEAARLLVARIFNINPRVRVVQVAVENPPDLVRDHFQRFAL